MRLSIPITSHCTDIIDREEKLAFYHCADALKMSNFIWLVKEILPALPMVLLPVAVCGNIPPKETFRSSDKDLWLPMKC